MVLAAGAALLLVAGYSAAQMTGSGRRALPPRPLPPGLSAPAVRFEDVAGAAGLTGVSVSGSDKRQDYIVENTGTGVAIFDYDNDGLSDLLFVNADRFDRTGPEPRHYLYRNLGNLRFEDVTEKSGITHRDWGQGVCTGDVDNDGAVDVFITAWGVNHLWRNQGSGRFQDETEIRGLAAPRRWSTGCAFLDYDRDGALDLFVAHYLKFDPAKVPKPGQPGECMWKGFAVVCGPMGLPPETMSLYRNDGQGRFSDVSTRAGVDHAKAAGLSVLSSDFDNDGWPDVYVTGDSTPSLFFRNRGNGTFEEIAPWSGIAFNEDGREQSGMGVSAGDYDRDGMLDLVKTNFSDDTPNLYRNEGKGLFLDVTAAAGLATRTQLVGWGTAFVDFDNDGWRDIFIANGHVYPDIDGRGIGQTFRQTRLLYWNRRDGQFFDLTSSGGPGISTPHSSRGTAVGDLDNDGSLEIVTVNLHEGPSLLKNRGERGNSLLIRLLTAAGRDAIGARVSVQAGGTKQVDEVRSGGNYLSQSDMRLHFGLGAARQAELEVRWPDGRVEKFPAQAANRAIQIRQGRGTATVSPLRRAE